MGDLFKQKLAIIVAFGISSLLIFFVSIGIYNSILNDQLNNYSNKCVEHIDMLMDIAKTRNQMVLDYATSDTYFNDTYENILEKQRQDGYITSLCKEVKSLNSYVQSVLAIMESGEVYSSDDTFDSYIEQFKNIQNSEFYKDTCMANAFEINRFNKYYNVECYSYSDSIYDINGRKVGTVVITYSLNWVWNDINNLNKDDFVGTVIYETFDKQILSIIDENGVERYADNDLIGERANKLLEQAQSKYVKADYDRQFKVYFLPNSEVLSEIFDSTRAICVTIVLAVLLAIIVLTFKRKEKFLFEIIVIVITAVIVLLALWVSFLQSYYNASALSIKINQYGNEKIQEQLEVSFERGVEAYSDYIQSSLLKSVSNQLTTKEFNNVFASLVLEKGIPEFKKIKKMFLFGKTAYIYLDENRKIDFDNSSVAYTNKTERDVYSKIIKSGNNEYYEIEKDKVSGHMLKTMYYKIRVLSKYTLVFTVQYDVTNFFDVNTNKNNNYNEIGETYYINYDEKYEVNLVRSNELSTIESNYKNKSVSVDDTIFDGKIKDMIEKRESFSVIKATSSNGNPSRAICFNNFDIKRIDVYFIKENVLLKCKRIILITELVEIGLFLALLLYNYLEIKRIKRKEKKEEIVLHGNF